MRDLITVQRATSMQGTGLRMQSLLRNVCRAGSRGAAARLLEFAAPVATQPSVTQSSPAIQHLKSYGFSHPIGVGFLLEIHAVGMPLTKFYSNLFLSFFFRDQFLCAESGHSL